MDADRLRAINAFETLPHEDLQRIAWLAHEASVAPGAVLVREGDFSYEFMAIEQGTADVHQGSRRVAQLGPGDFFGETGVLRRAPRSATVLATSHMRLITLSRWDFKRLAKLAPHLISHIEATVRARESSNRALAAEG